MLKLLNLRSVASCKSTNTINANNRHSAFLFLLVNNSKLIHTSVVKCLDQDWRSKQRLPVNPNSESPLTSLPDFTYMDGRPTPLGVSQL